MNVLTNGHKRETGDGRLETGSRKATQTSPQPPAPSLPNKKDPTTGLDDGRSIAKLMAPFYRELLKEAFGDASDAGLAVSFDLDNPLIQSVLADRAKRIRSVTEKTKEDVRLLLGRQADEGWSDERTAQEIIAKGEIASKTRAILISRTETAATYSQGSLAAYKLSGVVKQTEWLTAGDDDDCPICAALNGTRAELGETFDGDIDAPPAHPACRCVLQPVIDS